MFLGTKFPLIPFSPHPFSGLVFFELKKAKGFSFIPFNFSLNLEGS